MNQENVSNKLKFFAIFFAVIVTLSGVFCLSACSGDQAFVGNWQTSTADNEKLKDSQIAKVLIERVGQDKAEYLKDTFQDSFSIKVNIESGNKATLIIVGMQEEGTWKSSSSTEGQLTIGQTTVDMKLDADKLTLTNGNISIPLEKK